MTRRVDFTSLDPGELGPVIGAERQAAFLDAGARAREGLNGRVIVHVNSTATGGGVAEMLPTLLGYAKGFGIDTRWYVITGTPAFFDVTKRLHNRIHGFSGDLGDLGVAERITYDQVMVESAPELLALLRPTDVVVLHDPQTLGLAPLLRRATAQVIWRCHIGSDKATEITEEAWDFLSPYLEHITEFVFSRSDYRPSRIPRDRVRVITPSLDPLSPKNRVLSAVEVHDILVYTGLLQGAAGEPPVYARRDGSIARLERRADIIQLGPPPPSDQPMIVQVSRWDRLKDMLGVLNGFAQTIAPAGPGHLMLAGPNVSGVSDDPEGAAAYQACIEGWRALPHEQRQRIHLACLPVADVEENALIVNALQRHATVVAQKSLAEGFGLTVVEAMWKARPVVATAIGGIQDQITDGHDGLLLADPTDLATFGKLVRQLLDDPEMAHRIGLAASQRAADFLPDLHLNAWANVLADLAAR
ncbi:MAG: glycosyltransferase [Nakamurella sp.]